MWCCTKCIEQASLSFSFEINDSATTTKNVATNKPILDFSKQYYIALGIRTTDNCCLGFLKSLVFH